MLDCAIAGHADEAALRAVLRDNAMPGWIDLSFEREPDWFAGSRLMGESAAVVARLAPYETVGMYSHAWLPIHLNGAAADAGYLGGLRVNRAYRHHIRVLRQGYASIPRLFPANGACRFTSLAKDNAPARRLLEAGVPGLPHYRPVGELVTLALPVPPFWRRPRLALEAAGRADIPALAEAFNRAARAWQFAPCLSEAWLAGLDGGNGLRLADFLLLKRDGGIVAALALWDQRAFKQTRVGAYRFPLGLARPLWNAWAGLVGGIALPAVGEQIEQIYLAFALLPEPPELATAVVAAALREVRRRGGGIGVLGLSARHPLLPALRKTFAAMAYPTVIETVHWPDEAAPVLDGRPPQPEAALL